MGALKNDGEKSLRSGTAGLRAPLMAGTPQEIRPIASRLNSLESLVTRLNSQMDALEIQLEPMLRMPNADGGNVGAVTEAGTSPVTQRLEAITVNLSSLSQSIEDLMRRLEI